MTTNKAGTREEWLKAHSNCSTQKIGGSVSEALARPPPRDVDSECKSCVLSVFFASNFHSSTRVEIAPSCPSSLQRRLSGHASLPDREVMRCAHSAWQAWGWLSPAQLPPVA
jgi:hypothetical protein